jgi:hypothetical protein
LAGVLTFDDEPGGIEEAKANARRIIACVNACEGVESEALNTGIVKHWYELADYSPDFDAVKEQNATLTARIAELEKELKNCLDFAEAIECQEDRPEDGYTVQDAIDDSTRMAEEQIDSIKKALAGKEII